MSIKFIHTGDLHIGQRLKKNSRRTEHRKLLEWLHEEVLDTKAELLLISGDVFDSASPSPDSMRLFTTFLASLESISTLRSVIITAGNHDSARRLDSLKPVLKRLGIHIVGAFQNRDTIWDEWLIPVYGGDGSLVAAVAAVPFIHEYRLGVSKGTRQNYANEIKDAFRDVYDHFAKLAQEKYPGVPHIAMGHLTAMNEAEVVGSAPQNVHIAVENGMDGSIFGDSYDYIALGHIHKNYRVRGTANAYYCGSPLPCSIDEAEDSQNRGVWFVDLSVSKIPVQRALPALREFIRWKEDISTLEQKLISLTWPKEQEPPFVWLCVQTGTPRYDLWDSFTQLLLSRTKEERPILVNIDNVVGSENVESEERVDISTTPHEIFDALLQYKEIPKTPQLQGLFDELLSKVTSLKEEKV